MNRNVSISKGVTFALCISKPSSLLNADVNAALQRYLCAASRRFCSPVHTIVQQGRFEFNRQSSSFADGTVANVHNSLSNGNRDSGSGPSIEKVVCKTLDRPVRKSKLPDAPGRPSKKKSNYPEEQRPDSSGVPSRKSSTKRRSVKDSSPTSRLFDSLNESKSYTSNQTGWQTKERGHYSSNHPPLYSQQQNDRRIEFSSSAGRNNDVDESPLRKAVGKSNNKSTRGMNPNLKYEPMRGATSSDLQKRPNDERTAGSKYSSKKYPAGATNGVNSHLKPAREFSSPSSSSSSSLSPVDSQKINGSRGEQRQQAVIPPSIGGSPPASSLLASSTSTPATSMETAVPTGHKLMAAIWEADSLHAIQALWTRAKDVMQPAHLAGLSYALAILVQRHEQAALAATENRVYLSLRGVPVSSRMNPAVSSSPPTPVTPKGSYHFLVSRDSISHQDSEGQSGPLTPYVTAETSARDSNTTVDHPSRFHVQSPVEIQSAEEAEYLKGIAGQLGHPPFRIPVSSLLLRHPFQSSESGGSISGPRAASLSLHSPPSFPYTPLSASSASSASSPPSSSTFVHFSRLPRLEVNLMDRPGKTRSSSSSSSAEINSADDGSKSYGDSPRRSSRFEIGSSSSGGYGGGSEGSSVGTNHSGGWISSLFSSKRQQSFSPASMPETTDSLSGASISSSLSNGATPDAPLASHASGESPLGISAQRQRSNDQQGVADGEMAVTNGSRSGWNRDVDLHVLKEDLEARTFLREIVQECVFRFCSSNASPNVLRNHRSSTPTATAGVDAPIGARDGRCEPPTFPTTNPGPGLAKDLSSDHSCPIDSLSFENLRRLTLSWASLSHVVEIPTPALWRLTWVLGRGGVFHPPEMQAVDRVSPRIGASSSSASPSSASPSSLSSRPLGASSAPNPPGLFKIQKATCADVASLTPALAHLKEVITRRQRQQQQQPQQKPRYLREQNHPSRRGDSSTGSKWNTTGSTIRDADVDSVNPLAVFTPLFDDLAHIAMRKGVHEPLDSLPLLAEAFVFANYKSASSVAVPGMVRQSPQRREASSSDSDSSKDPNGLYSSSGSSSMFPAAPGAGEERFHPDLQGGHEDRVVSRLFPTAESASSWIPTPLAGSHPSGDSGSPLLQLPSSRHDFSVVVSDHCRDFAARVAARATQGHWAKFEPSQLAPIMRLFTNAGFYDPQAWNAVSEAFLTRVHEASATDCVWVAHAFAFNNHLNVGLFDAVVRRLLERAAEANVKNVFAEMPGWPSYPPLLRPPMSHASPKSLSDHPPSDYQDIRRPSLSLISGTGDGKHEGRGPPNARRGAAGGSEPLSAHGDRVSNPSVDMSRYSGRTNTLPYNHAPSVFDGDHSRGSGGDSVVWGNGKDTEARSTGRRASQSTNEAMDYELSRPSWIASLFRRIVPSSSSSSASDPNSTPSSSSSISSMDGYVLENSPPGRRVSSDGLLEGELPSSKSGEEVSSIDSINSYESTGNAQGQSDSCSPSSNKRRDSHNGPRVSSSRTSDENSEASIPSQDDRQGYFAVSSRSQRHSHRRSDPSSAPAASFPTDERWRKRAAVTATNSRLIESLGKHELVILANAFGKFQFYNAEMFNALVTRFLRALRYSSKRHDSRDSMRVAMLARALSSFGTLHAGTLLDIELLSVFHSFSFQDIDAKRLTNAFVAANVFPAALLPHLSRETLSRLQAPYRVDFFKRQEEAEIRNRNLVSFRERLAALVPPELTQNLRDAVAASSSSSSSPLSSRSSSSFSHPLSRNVPSIPPPSHPLPFPTPFSSLSSSSVGANDWGSFDRLGHTFKGTDTVPFPLAGRGAQLVAFPGSASTDTGAAAGRFPVQDATAKNIFSKGDSGASLDGQKQRGLLARDYLGGGNMTKDGRETNGEGHGQRQGQGQGQGQGKGHGQQQGHRRVPPVEQVLEDIRSVWGGELSRSDESLLLALASPDPHSHPLLKDAPVHVRGWVMSGVCTALKLLQTCVYFGRRQGDAEETMRQLLVGFTRRSEGDMGERHDGMTRRLKSRKQPSSFALSEGKNQKNGSLQQNGLLPLGSGGELSPLLRRLLSPTDFLGLAAAAGSISLMFHQRRAPSENGGNGEERLSSVGDLSLGILKRTLKESWELYDSSSWRTTGLSEDDFRNIGIASVAYITKTGREFDGEAEGKKMKKAAIASPAEGISVRASTAPYLLSSSSPSPDEISSEINRRWRAAWFAADMGASSAHGMARAMSYNRLERLLKQMGFEVMQGSQETEDRLFRTCILAIPQPWTKSSAAVKDSPFSFHANPNDAGDLNDRGNDLTGSERRGDDVDREQSSSPRAPPSWSALAFDFEAEDAFETKASLSVSLGSSTSEGDQETDSDQAGNDDDHSSYAKSRRLQDVAPQYGHNSISSFGNPFSRRPHLSGTPVVVESSCSMEERTPPKTLNVLGMASFRSDCLLHRGWLAVPVPLQRWEAAEEHLWGSRRLIEDCIATAKKRALLRLDDGI